MDERRTGMDNKTARDVASVAEMQRAVKAARAARSRLRVVGMRSVERFASQPRAKCWDRVSTAGLGGIEVAGRDFTVRVGAGVTLADLDEVLAPLGLVWPVRRVEAPGTVGGLIASGRGTTIATPDGPARRWVLGAWLVDGTGEVLTVGGATVKNSVGYGLTHALWGSQGLLGAIVGVTLRVRRRNPGDDDPGQTLEPKALEAANALVRCEDLRLRTAGRAVVGLSRASQAAVSCDGLRAVGCYPEREPAEADAAALKAQGIEARVEPERVAGSGSVAIATVRAALDPDGVLV
ncbi:MAG: FAD-binding protein [Chloroflexota bacterium]|nr:FAD-binding protein [Chloroflexota bacterium]MDE2896883.1 FAD-binding protein [Chloroflexota bacterium]